MGESAIRKLGNCQLFRDQYRVHRSRLDRIQTIATPEVISNGREGEHDTRVFCLEVLKIPAIRRILPLRMISSRMETFGLFSRVFGVMGMSLRPKKLAGISPTYYSDLNILNVLSTQTNDATVSIPVRTKCLLVASSDRETSCSFFLPYGQCLVRHDDALLIDVRNRQDAGDVLEFVPPGHSEPIRLRLYSFEIHGKSEPRNVIHAGQNLLLRVFWHDPAYANGRELMKLKKLGEKRNRKICQ